MKALTRDYALLELLVVRGLTVLAILIPTALIKLGVDGLKMNRPAPMLARGVLSFFAFSSYYVAITVIPLADAAALFLSAPLFVTALSVFILRERVGVHRWGAVLIGFSMVVFILNPGSDLFHPIAALPLLSALCYAVIPILTRMIGTTEHVVTMTIYLKTSYLVLCFIALGIVHFGGFYNNDNVFLAPITMPWTWFARDDLLLIIIAGMIFTLALLLITQAYRVAVVSAVSPFEYSMVFWAAVVGYIGFGDIPTLRLVFGASIMVMCGIYITRREARLGTASD